MRFQCGTKKTRAEQLAALEAKWCRWHRWFAWRPVRVGGGFCCWLEFVERRACRVSSVFLEPKDFKYRAAA